MGSLSRYLVRRAMPLLPDTRCYRLKRWLLRRSGIEVADGTRVTSSVKILGTCRVAIGEDTFIGHDVLIGGGDCNIVIGNCVDIAPRVVVVAGSHEIDMLGEHSAGRGISRGITIEDGAWIGAGAVIIGGVRIGNKAIIGAGSVVVHDIPPYTVAMGNPCRPAKIWDAQTNRWNCTRQRSTTIEDRK